MTTTDQLWQAVIEAPDPITRDEASRTYIAFTLQQQPTTRTDWTNQ